MDSKGTDRKELLKSAVVRIEQLEKRLAAAEQRHHEPIAVVGVGCRFPGGSNGPDAFWRLLRDGTDAIVDIPTSRWKLEDFYDADPDAPGKMYARGGGFVDDVDLFDPGFFGIAPREAPQMDPQQRLLLETAWVTLEHAGIAPGSLTGSSTGVFIGMTTHDYARMQANRGGLEFIDTYFGTGVAGSVAAGRLSYVLGLRGPAVTVDTACSSSLVAIHLACQSLRNQETRLALAGGVNLILWPEGHVIASKGRMLAPDSRCKTFDARADGYVRSEGCGLVALKRLSDAVADGDPVLAVIRGTALNQDGRSSGLTAPNGRAQEDVIRQALADAGVAPSEVAYVETHGTGTSLGDPIEVQALAGALGAGRPADRPLLIGSVKTNIGHLEAAAGVAGLIKAVLALHHDEIPPHLHFQTPNPLIPWSELPIQVAAARRSWPGSSRIIGVSSFGFSGTNAHIVLDAAPSPPPRASVSQRPVELLVLSARTPASLDAAAARAAQALETSEPERLADVCYTAAAGRTHFEHRLAVIGSSPAEIVERLEDFRAARPSPAMVRGEASLKRPPEVAFVFTGQGSQYVNMGRALYDTEPAFCEAMNRCDAILQPRLGASLLSVLYPPDGQEAASEARLVQTAWTQPALFAIEFALAQLWQSWGILPSAVMGHSVGEYVAACVAGIFTLEDGLALIAERGRLMQDLPAGGAMVAVPLSESVVAAAIEPVASEVSIGAVNASSQTVVSGTEAGVASVIEALGGAELKTQRLSVSHAFHSPLIEPMLDAFERFAAGITYQPPRVPIVSNVTGTVVDAPATLDAKYWRRHARAAVRFADSLETARTIGCRVMLEVGPHPTLMGLAARGEPSTAVTWVPSLRRRQDDLRQMSTSLGAMFAAGVPIDWNGYERNSSPRKVQIPITAFDRQRFWIETAVAPAPRRAQAAPVTHPLLGRRLLSPRSSDVVFEHDWSDDVGAAIRDHRIFGRVIAPAAAYLEMAISGADAVFGPGGHIVEDLVISEPLVIEAGASRTVQVHFARSGEQAASVEIHSRDATTADPDAPWSLHASGRVTRPGASADVVSDASTEAESTRTPIAAETYYTRLAAGGVEYGPAFRGLTGLERIEGEAIASLAIPAAVSGEASEYHLHPGILDACFQALGVALPGGSDPASAEHVYLPVQVGRYRVVRPAEPQMRAMARVAPGDANRAETFVGSVVLRNAAGEPIAEISDLRFKRASRAALDRRAANVNEWLHEIEWQPIDVMASESRQKLTGRWLVFCDGENVGRTLRAELAADGAECSLVFPSETYSPLSSGVASVRPGAAEDFEALLRDHGDASSVAGVVHLWNLDLGLGLPEHHADLSRARELGSVSVLHLVQALVALGHGAPLTIVTRGAQATAPGAPSLSALQASAWGLGRVIAAEQPEFLTKLIDLDPQLSSDVSGSALAGELASGDRSESQIALRGGQRLAARFVKSGESHARAAGLTVPTGPFGLEIPQRGVLENLQLTPLRVEPPKAGEIQIRVQASGLNFRDVLNVLGMYPGDPGPLGGEAVGVVETVGPGVARFAVGDPVLALVPRGFVSLVNTSEKLAWHRPAQMTVAEAATIPLVFQTAHYALNHLAGMRTGERVLIHAGAGGVGLAAIQLAQIAGAEIFATAGSPVKREFLRGLGVQHVMDSRSLDFADEIRAATGGEGIDIVLNSLAGEFIPKSLEVLRDGGRFLELGKTDLWDEKRAAEVNPRASYLAVYLGDACLSQPDLVQRMFGELMAWFASGRLKPLARRTWAIDRAVEAFRFMAQARHIGKIVIEQEPAAGRPLIRPDGSYLVTGAFGGIGLAVTRWLADSGARHITLVGRRAPDESARALIREIQADGVAVTVASADVGDDAAMREVLSALDGAGQPLRGVIHAAGVVDDGMLVQQHAQRFATVMRPKVDGAWALHRLCDGRALDFFVLFSAGAALFGSPGQSNYAAANAFLDALAWQRRGEGQTALSIDWGAWRDAGMAARVSERDRERWASQGVGTIDTPRGLVALERAIRDDVAQVAVLPMDWPRFLAQWPRGAAPALFTALSRTIVDASAPPDAGGAGVLASILAADPGDRRALLESHVREQVGRVLGVSPASLYGEREFSELGMDSLMAVELSNRLKRSLSRHLPATVAFERPTIAALTDFLLGDIASSDGALAAATPVAAAVTPPATDAAGLLASLGNLSDADVDAMLGAMLEESQESK